MKKLNFAVFGALMLTCLTTRALADTTIPWTKEGCESVKGTWVTAHSPDDDGCDAAHCNGMNFCRGPKGTNWFSALIWCKSIGHQLASFANVCPGMPTGNGPCANVNKVGSGFGWTSMMWTGNAALTVELSSGSPQSYARNYSYFNSRFTPPLCEE